MVPATSTTRQQQLNAAGQACPESRPRTCWYSTAGHSLTQQEPGAKCCRASAKTLKCGRGVGRVERSDSCMSSANLWYATPCELMRPPTGDVYAVKSRVPRTDP